MLAFVVFEDEESVRSDVEDLVSLSIAQDCTRHLLVPELIDKFDAASESGSLELIMQPGKF